MDSEYMESKYIAFDCETTGLNDNCNLLTVSFIVLDTDLNEIETLNISLKQNNGYYVYPEAMAVNKINLIKHHSKSIDLIDARKVLHTFLRKHKLQYNLIPIGHNIQFDIKFIKKSGLLTEAEYASFISYNSIDTVCVAQFLKLSGVLHEKQSISLVNLCANAQIKRQENLEHSAEYDTRMTIKLLKFFKSSIQNETGNQNKKRKLSSN
jgi:DNA polymerase III alpha subunit (gram-positive type)